MIRHGAGRDTLASWLREDLGLSTHTEQEVPRWNTARERAILDVVYAGPAANAVKMDVSVVDGATTHGGVRQAKWCLARRGKTKHNCYPGPGLVVIVLDTRGRWGHEATAWLRAVGRRVPLESRAEAMAKCRYKVTVALQMGVADQIWSACWSHDRTRQRNAYLVPCAASGLLDPRASVRLSPRWKTSFSACFSPLPLRLCAVSAERSGPLPDFFALAPLRGLLSLSPSLRW